MGVLQRSVNHSVIGRAIADRTIQARDPQLLNLPLPSIPVLSPLLSPLVGTGNDPKTTTTKASPPPQQTPPSSSGGSSGSSNGGGNSGGSGGNSGGSSGSGSSPPSSGNSGGSSSSGSGSSNSPPPSSGSSSSSSSSGTTPGDNPSPSNGDGSPGTSPSGTTPSSSSGSTTPSSSGSGDNVDNQSSSVGGSSVLSSASGNGTDGSGSSNGGAPPAGVANAGSIPGSGTGSSGSSGVSGSSGSSGSHTAGTSVAIGASSPSTSQGTSDGTGSASVGGTGTGAAQTGGHHGLSGGAIAVIVMVLLFLIVACLIFFVRRRTRARRDERANAWWFSRKRNSQTYGDRDSKEIPPTSGTRSARSSFATTVDHSTRPRRSSEFIIPPLPPMAEVGRANGAAPTLVLDTSHFANGQASDTRFSIGSGHSNTSDNSTAQYLVVPQHDGMGNQELGTPMSVRPFSPSESFSFPRPPDPVSDRTSAYSRLSAGTFGVAPKSQSSPTDGSFRFSGDVPPTPALPAVTVSPTPINTTTDAITSDPFADNNPFDDPLATASSASTGEFADVEYIRRPFFPTLPDELAVKPDESVRILQAFDDGWALVEKVDRKGKGKEDTPSDQGLIPIDCLREPGQDLTTFIAAKRLSSYAESLDVGRNSITAL